MQRVPPQRVHLAGTAQHYMFSLVCLPCCFLDQSFRVLPLSSCVVALVFFFGKTSIFCKWKKVCACLPTLFHSSLFTTRVLLCAQKKKCRSLVQTELGDRKMLRKRQDESSLLKFVERGVPARLGRRAGHVLTMILASYVPWHVGRAVVADHVWCSERKKLQKLASRGLILGFEAGLALLQAGRKV